MSKLLRLSWKDLIKAAVVAIFAMSAVAIYKALLLKGLALTVEDVNTLKAVLSGAGIGYLAKQLLTDEDGKLGGKL